MSRIASIAIAAVLLAIPAPVLAQGCAMCRTSLQNGDDPLVGAMNTSVIFLMTMPYLIVGSIGGWIYLATRRQRTLADPAAAHESVEGDDT